MRRALAHFPDPGMARRIMKRYYIHGGKAPDEAFKAVPRFTVTPPVALQELAVVGTFCEVWLAKQEHSGPVGINFLRKIEIPLPFGLLGAMLAGGFIGWFIDRQAGTGPWGLITMLLLGFVTGLTQSLRRQKRMDQESAKRDEE